MVLLDTNVLVYAANTSCEFNRVACDLRDKAVKGDIDGCISLQNLSEFYSIITSQKRVANPLSPEDAIEEIEKYINTIQLTKVHFKDSTVKILCALVRQYKVAAQDIYDLKIVAIMIDNNIKEIFTANDKDFLQYSKIKVTNPFK